MSKEVLKFDAEIEKIFQLMIHSIYENKEIFLRELISNASDACDKLRYQAVTKPDILGKDKEFKITIKADKEAKTLTITDNGIGMSRADLIKNLGTVARSGTQRFAQQITGDDAKDSNLIGQFGVGFYSSFMVAEKVKVISCAAGGKKAHIWESAGTGKFTIDEAKEKYPRGTTVILHLRDEEAEYLDEYRLRHVIETYSNHVAFTIALIKEDGTEDIVNKGKAIWARSKSDISEDEYKEFYRSVSFMGQDEPFMTLHNKAEGVIEYTNLLYIPSSQPFDLFHPDRSTRVKLYVKRVFIADEGIDLIPSYLRFLRGVVDSEDLPLNISRETVQNNLVVQKIKASITNRVIKELKTKMTKDLDGYMKFWENFGSVVKEGLCDGYEPRDEIIEICRFRTTKSGDKTITLKEYKDNMKEGQNAIFFITGDDVESAMASPQLEGFKKKDYEVVLLTDSVDEFWVNVLHEYQGIELKSVTRADSEDSLEEKDSAKAQDEDGEKKEDVKSVNIGEHNSVELVSFIKDNLGDRVKDVRTTHRLTDSPVCLVAAEGAMDIRMERFMVDNKQMAQANAKVFEINPEHPIIVKLANELAENKNIKTLSDTIHLLFAQANIIEGEPVKDIAGFNKRMNELMQKALAA